MFGFDLLVGTLFPAKYTLFGDKAVEGYHHYLEDPNKPEGRQACGLGPMAWKATQALHEMIAAAARIGQNVVADHHLFLDPPILQDIVWRLHDVPVLLVSLRPPYDVLIERVNNRTFELPQPFIEARGPDAAKDMANSLTAASPWFFEADYANDCNDLVVDSSRHSPEEVCELIQHRLDKGPGTAFAMLRQRYSRPTQEAKIT
jgi:chloramphenicol 3-O-phosphotransferase